MKSERTSIFWLALALSVAGCKSREEPAPAPLPPPTAEPTPDPSAPRLPLGMLARGEDGAPGPEQSAGSGLARRLRSARDVSSGEWIELQPAASGEAPKRTTFEHFRSGSLLLPLDAMTLLHGAFVRAEPAFDTFVPQLLDPRALGRLRAALADFQSSWTAVSTVKEAQQRWEFSPLVRGLSSDAEWREAQTALVATISDISRMAEDLEKKGMSAWVLSAH